jgi:hypothetical protein
MKLRLCNSTLLALALLVAAVIGCKNVTSSAPTTNTQDHDKQTHISNSKPSAPSVPASEIAGKYNVVGTNPGGPVYRGTLQVFARGDVLQFRWNAGAQYDGVGVVNGDVVAVAFASGTNGKGCGVVDYTIKDDGTLDGKWGYWGLNDSGTETANRTSGSGLVGEYDATGKNPDGKEYKAKLTVELAVNRYRFSWSNNTEGLGIKQGDNVAVGIGGARCGFVAYEIKSDGKLEGVWGGYGTEKTGTETATKQ